MKSLCAFLSCILFWGCATSYNSMIELKAVGIQKAENEDVTLTVGVQDLGDNNRFRSKAYETGTALLKVTVESKTEGIVVDKIEVLNEGEDALYPQLTPSIAADKMSLHTWPYLLWGLLWFGYTKCENDDCHGTWIPVGLIIGIINVIKAKETNRGFEKEITSHQFKPGSLKRGETNEGLLFLTGRSLSLRIRVAYRSSSSEVKHLAVPYGI